MKSILVIYTGGTIGMVRDKVSGALVPLDFSQVSRHVPELAQAGIRVEAVSFDTPIDSSDVMPKHWRSLALTVAELRPVRRLRGVVRDGHHGLQLLLSSCCRA